MADFRLKALAQMRFQHGMEWCGDFPRPMQNSKSGWGRLEHIRMAAFFEEIPAGAGPTHVTAPFQAAFDTSRQLAV